MSFKFVILYVVGIVSLTRLLNWQNIPDVEIRATRGYLKYKPNEHGEVIPYELHILNPFGGEPFIKEVRWANIRNYERESVSTYHVDVKGEQYWDPDLTYVSNFLWANLILFVTTGVGYVLIYGS